MSETVLRLKRTYITVRNAFDEELSRYQLTASQFEVLQYLRSSEGMKQQQLQQNTGVTSATLTGLLDKLEHRELLQRIPSKEDGRAKIVVLTQRGEDLIDSLDDLSMQFEDRMLEHFSQTERMLFFDWLQKAAFNCGDTDPTNNEK